MMVKSEGYDFDFFPTVLATSSRFLAVIESRVVFRHSFEVSRNGRPPLAYAKQPIHRDKFEVDTVLFKYGSLARFNVMKKGSDTTI
jgi:hypothetical protein